MIVPSDSASNAEILRSVIAAQQMHNDALLRVMDCVMRIASDLGASLESLADSGILIDERGRTALAALDRIVPVDSALN